MRILLSCLCLFVVAATGGHAGGQSLAEPDVPTGLLERRGDKIVAAPPADLALAKTYHAFKDKGPVLGGRRITILTH